MIFFKGAVRRGLLTVVSGSVLATVALLMGNIGAASAAQFTQCPQVGSDTGCAQLIVVNKTGPATVQVDPTQGPYDGVEDTLIGVQNNSGKPLASLNLGSPSGTNIMGFDGDGICYPSQWPAPTTTVTPPGCPNPAVGTGFGPTGYEGPGTSFSNISPNTTTGTVNFNPAIKAGGSAYFALEEALQSGQLRSSQSGPIPGPITVSGRTVQFQLTCVGAASCAGKARLLIRRIGNRLTSNILGNKGHIVVIGSVPVSIPAGLTSNVLIKPNKMGKGLLTSHRGGFKTTIRVLLGSTSYTMGLAKLK